MAGMDDAKSLSASAMDESETGSKAEEKGEEEEFHNYHIHPLNLMVIRYFFVLSTLLAFKVVYSCI